MLLAEVDPLAPAGKVMGIVLALCVIVASLYLLFRQRTRSTASAEEQLANQNPWRAPVAVLMGFIGILIIAGVLIDPTQHRRLFVIVWAINLCLVMVLLFAAGFDMLTIRRRAFRRRIELLRENQQEMEDELKQYYRARAHHGNGTPLNGPDHQ